MRLQYSPISPMKALFWSAVINGVAAVPLMAVIIVLGVPHGALDGVGVELDAPVFEEPGQAVPA